MKSKKTIVNDKCIGCRLCTILCPKAYEMNGEKSQALEKQGESEEELKNSIKSCPVEAISWKTCKDKV